MKLYTAAALGLTALTTTQLVAQHVNTAAAKQTEAKARLLHAGTAFAHLAGDACGCPFCCGKVNIDAWAPAAAPAIPPVKG